MYLKDYMCDQLFFNQFLSDADRNELQSSMFQLDQMYDYVWQAKMNKKVVPSTTELVKSLLHENGQSSSQKAPLSSQEATIPSIKSFRVNTVSDVSPAHYQIPQEEIQAAVRKLDYSQKPPLHQPTKSSVESNSFCGGSYLTGFKDNFKCLPDGSSSQVKKLDQNIMSNGIQILSNGIDLIYNNQ